MATKTERLEIRAKESFVRRLDELATASGTSKAEVIDRAVGLYAYALQQAQEGNDLYFAPLNQNEMQTSDTLKPRQPLEEEGKTVNEKMLLVLGQLKSEFGIDMSESFRRGVDLFFLAKRQEAQGRRLAFIDGDDNVVVEAKNPL